MQPRIYCCFIRGRDILKSAIKKVVTMEYIANAMKSEFYRSFDIMKAISRNGISKFINETNLDRLWRYYDRINIEGETKWEPDNWIKVIKWKNRNKLGVTFAMCLVFENRKRRQMVVPSVHVIKVKDISFNFSPLFLLIVEQKEFRIL